MATTDNPLVDSTVYLLTCIVRDFSVVSIVNSRYRPSIPVPAAILCILYAVWCQELVMHQNGVAEEQIIVRCLENYV